jgi:hypothetical protein
MKKVIFFYPVFTICLCLFFCIHSSAQVRQFLLSDAETLFNKKQGEVLNVLINREYSFVQNVDGILEYRRTTPWGYFDLSLLFSKAGRLRDISWQEHIAYANVIASEVQNGGYERDQANQIFGTDVVINSGKNLRILITPHPETNIISLNMQIPPAAPTKAAK